MSTAKTLSCPGCLQLIIDSNTAIGANFNNNEAFDTFTFDAGKWYCMTFSWNDTGWTWFVNNADLGYQAVSTGGLNVNPLTVGCHDGSNYGLNGWIDELKISNVIKDLQDITVFPLTTINQPTISMGPEERLGQ